MEVGAHVWLRSPSSQWGWVPARIVDREETSTDGRASPPAAATTSSGVGWKPKQAKSMVRLTLRDDTGIGSRPGSASSVTASGVGGSGNGLTTPRNGVQLVDYNNELNYFADVQPFETTLIVDASTLANADHPDIKLRNLPTSFQVSGGDPEASVITSPSTKLDSSVVGGVHDLIGLTHLHEPAILHALRLRYDSGVIYTSTGPILIAINPFQKMDGMYSPEVMERYRLQGEGLRGESALSMTSATPYKKNGKESRSSSGGHSGSTSKLPPHAYKTADDAYRAMKRGLENTMLMGSGKRSSSAGQHAPTDQSILVSGESGAGKTVTTKIVLNYFAMLSKKITEEEEVRNRSASSQRSGFSPAGRNAGGAQKMQQQRREEEEVCIEQQVLQSNPILEAFGNARTLRNDNSSRFGKYIDIRFTPQGKLSGAKIETYLLEKVRLIHPSAGERNYHVFYQFLEAASGAQRAEFGLDDLNADDFRLLNGTGTYDRRDGVVDGDMHMEMLDAMVSRREGVYWCLLFRVVCSQQITHAYRR